MFYPSKLTVAVIFVPQLLVVAITVIYACKLGSARIFFQYSPPVLQALPFTLCIVICLWAPLAILLALYHSFIAAVLPWPGWSAVHAHFKRPVLLPSFIQPPALRQVEFVLFWTYVTTAFIAIACILSGEGFQSECKDLWNFVKRKFITLCPTFLSPSRVPPVRPPRPSSSLDLSGRLSVIRFDDGEDNGFDVLHSTAPFADPPSFSRV
jgi:hypothetical protein